ncbi:MAG: TonB-dependent receptor [Gammaproteobacteria bacterium]|nr:TonB-dependent receptor [Gammaproteobacteria bacterium]
MQQLQQELDQIKAQDAQRPAATTGQKTQETGQAAGAAPASEKATLATQPQAAPQAKSAAARQATPTAPLELNSVVVTAGRNTRKLNASYAITTANSQEIEKIAPRSTADLFKITPGVWVESSGGDSGANVFVRGFNSAGDAEFTTIQVDGMPVFPIATLSFLENSQLFRIDDTVDHMEGLRGGPNTVLSNGQAGVTFNFITREGGPVPHGEVKTTTSDFGTRRVDTFYSGPVSNNTFVALGGFFRTDDGIRGTQFPADRGEQFSAKITHILDSGTFTPALLGGKLSLSARYTNDHNVWYTDIPLVNKGGGSNGGVAQFPGFNVNYGTLAGDDNRLATLEVGPPDGSSAGPVTIRRDLADGRGPHIGFFNGGADLRFKGGWRFSEKFSYTTGTANTFGIVPDTTPQTAQSFLDQTKATANSDPAVVAAAGGMATSGTFTLTSTGAQLDPNTPVLQAGWWSVNKNIDAFANDARVTKDFEFLGDHSLTAGIYYASTNVQDLWYLGNDQLLTATPNAQRVDLVLDNGVKATRNGFSGAPFFDVNASYDGQSTAGFATDTWNPTDWLTLDAGIREENFKVHGAIENNNFGVNLDGNALTLYDNNAAALNGTFTAVNFNKSATSLTAGANVRLSDSLQVFGRGTRGKKFPSFDDLRSGVRTIQRFTIAELGVKSLYHTPFENLGPIGVFLTGYYTHFEGSNFQQFINGVNVNRVGGSHAKGVEFEVATRLFKRGQIQIEGTWQHAELIDFGTLSGNRVARQPQFQMRATPSYNFPQVGSAQISVYSTVTFVGNRYSDIDNQQKLPHYTTLDAGMTVTMFRHLSFEISGHNLTNKLGLTEGNPRVIGGQTGGVFFGRPILGRSILGSVAYQF